MTLRLACWCCGRKHVPRALDKDPWEGRLEGYCVGCSLCRCDAYPGACRGEGMDDEAARSYAHPHPEQTG